MGSYIFDLLQVCPATPVRIKRSRPSDRSVPIWRKAGFTKFQSWCC